MKISIIVTTYNWPQALERVLKSLFVAVDAQCEIVVADDGSTDETAQCIAQLVSSSPVPLRHVWQPDHGFRAGRVRNLAVLTSTGDYLVFLDGDCIVPHYFIARQRRLLESGYFVEGNRILLSEKFTKRVIAEQIDLSSQSNVFWQQRKQNGDCNRVLPLWYWPYQFGRTCKPRFWRRAKSCNLAVWRADFIAVDGFDEQFQGWGYEDSDFVIRLIRAGVRRKTGRFALPVFHLWHPEASRANEAANWQRLQQTLQASHIKSAVGLSALASHSDSNNPPHSTPPA